MVESLNRGKPAQTLGYSNMINVIRKRITYLDAGVAVTCGTLPEGGVVVGGGVQIITAFNSSGTDLLDVGTSADADEFATALVVSATAPVYVAFDELATNNSYSDTAETTLTATYAQSVADATAGVADIIFFYVVR